MIKLNLGCGTNILKGWGNHDDDVDISKPLPWGDDVASFIFAEHVVEHITYSQALDFFKECHRVLHPGGVCRIAVPSIERVFMHATPEYAKFAERWVPDDGTDFRRRAMTNILFRHGHQTAWTEALLDATLFYAGFNLTCAVDPLWSEHPELLGIEGHGKVIGDKFNRIETVVVEATK